MDQRKTPDAQRREGTAAPMPRPPVDEQDRHRTSGNGGHTESIVAGDRTEIGTEGRSERVDTGNGYERTTGRSPLTLMRQLVADVTVLFRKEAALAAAEVNQSVHSVTAALGSMVGGGAVLHAGIIFLLASAAIGLAQVMAPWLAALIVGSVVTVIGIIMLQAGKKKLEPSRFKPERTVDSLRKDKEALRRHTP